MAVWYVDDIDQVVDELTAAGVEFTRYDEFSHDAKGITASILDGIMLCCEIAAFVLLFVPEANLWYRGQAHLGSAA